MSGDRSKWIKARDESIARIKAEALREAADEIDRGPDLPLRPSVISELVRERADRIEADGRG